MDFNSLREYLANARQLLFTEGHLNQRFIHLENIEKDCNKTNLVQESVYIFCDQAEEVIKDVEEQLKNTVIDLSKLEDTVNRLKDCINTVGAGNMLTKVNHLGQLVKDNSDTLSLTNALMELKLESKCFEDEMDDYFMMLSHGESHSYDVDSLISAGLLNPNTLHFRRL